MAGKPTEGHPRVKRIRTSKDTSPTPTGNLSSQQLKHLLAFEQDLDRSKSRLQQFKSFLNGIRGLNDHDERTKQKHVLLECLATNRLITSDRGGSPLDDLLATWQLAVQLNNDSLCSLIPAILTSIIKSLSDVVDFREAGVQLCRKLLREEQSKLFERNLNAPKSKQHLIDPVLRLLTEIVTFDGGSIAQNVYHRRMVTFHRLDTFLSSVNDAREDMGDGRNRTSLRETAMRYLLANLKLQNRSIKAVLLCQYRVNHCFFHFLDRDSPGMVKGVLEAIRTSVLGDESLAFSTKRKFFNESALSGLASLYRRKDTFEHSNHPSIMSDVHALLLDLLASKISPLLPKSSGTGQIQQHDTNDSEPESQNDESMDAEAQRSHVQRLLQRLRPYADISQAKLMVDVFRERPDLLSDYFLDKTSISLDPKLTTTWVGYARFVLDVIQLPCCKTLLQRQSRSTQLIPELFHTMLPPPCDEKTMSRCLNHPSLLVKFVSTNILVASLQKFQSALLFWKSISAIHQGMAFSREMQSAFASRFPKVRHVIAQFLSCPKENVILYESFSRLLLLYYQCIPVAALDESFDVSPKLSECLQEASYARDGADDFKSCRYLVIEHLLQVARRSLDTQWWRPQDGSQASIIMSLLTSIIGMKDPERIERLSIVSKKMSDDHVLRPETALSMTGALVASIEHMGPSSINGVTSFLDDCASRIAKAPIVYNQQLIQEHIRPIQNSIAASSIDPLVVCVIEQWPHFQKNKALDLSQEVGVCLRKFLLYMNIVEPGRQISAWVLKSLEEGSTDEAVKTIFQENLGRPTEDELRHMRFRHRPEASTTQSLTRHSPKPIEIHESVGESTSAPPDESHDHPELYRWAREDVQDAVNEGMIGNLLLCLCSKIEAVRKEAVPNLMTCMVRLDNSAFSEKRQSHLLVGEAVETCADLEGAPLPYFVGAMAAECLQVVTDPLHWMYTKVCNFLYRAPKWNAQKLPTYWIRKVMLSGPTEFGGQLKEIEWLLNILFDGLRTPADMRLYTNNKVFDWLLSMSAAPTLSDGCTQKIVSILLRCTYVDGSTTLITRYGLLAWIMGQWEGTKVRRKRLATLARTAWETCDQGHVGAWNDGACLQVIRSLEAQAEK